LIKKTQSRGSRIPGKYRGVFPFVPKRAFFEKEALHTPVGRRVFEIVKDLGTEIRLTGSHNRITGIPGSTPREAYLESKRTLVVGVRKTLDFQTCKPSAHYQLPLVTGCPGLCQYCYLNTTLGKKPYLRVYVNIDEILGRAKEYIVSRLPEETVFEGAATSDPLPVEPLTGVLARTIGFFGEQEKGRFRFVTKFANVESLLQVPHMGHTRFRFSINARSVIESFEQGAPRLVQRIEAAAKVERAGYPTGFLIAPIIKYDGWQEEYREIFSRLKDYFGPGRSLTLELISHRFTKRAKTNILEVFPETTLPMEESERKFKFGQFGYGKYIYPPETMAQVKAFMHEMIQEYLPQAEIEYLI